MPYTERLRFRLAAEPDGENHPSRLYIEFLESEPSLLSQKCIAALFFVIPKGVSWEEVDRFVEKLGIGTFCIRHLASGEG
jgi:hypothetical protein